MLQIPEKGFLPSASAINVQPWALCDWIEASLLFDDSSVTKSDIVDMLIEYQICHDDNQDLAHRIADLGWEEFSRRQQWGGIPNTADISSTRIEHDIDWKDDIIRSFFVYLSTLKIYPDWAKSHQDFSNQGDLFEKVVEKIFPALLPGWNTYRAGWSPENTKNLPEIVDELCQRLHTKGAQDLNDWISPNANDGGLDIVCYRKYEDEREAMPAIFIQCASGKNWRDKVKTPDPGNWQKYLNSAVQPTTGIAAPFVIETQELRIASLTGQIIVFDRLRMLSAAREHNVALDAPLITEVTDWMIPRIDDLPRAG